MERYRPVQPFEMPAPKDDEHEERHVGDVGGVSSTSVELIQAVSKKISRTKYSDTVSALTRYAQSPVSEHNDDDQPSTKTRRIRGLLEGSDPAGMARYIDETVTAYPGGVFIHARGVRNADSDPESEALNVKEDVGAYHVSVGLGNFKRAMIINTTDRRIVNRTLGEIFMEVKSGWGAPVDILYHLVEEKYKGKKVRGSDKPLFKWARTNRPDEIVKIEKDETTRIV